MTSIHSLETHGDISHHFLFVCGNTNEKMIKLDPPLKNVIGVEVNSALIPRSEYTIEDGRDTFYYNYDGEDKEIELEHADYNLTELLNTINYSINGEGIPIVLYEDEDAKIICASGTGSSFSIYDRPGLNRMLGFHKTTHADFSVNSASRKMSIVSQPNVISLHSLNRLDNLHYGKTNSVEAYYSDNIYTNLLALQIDTTVLEKQQEGYFLNIDYNYNGTFYSSQYDETLLTFPAAIFVQNITNDANLSVNPYVYINGKIFLFITEPWFINYDWQQDTYSYRDIIRQAITDHGQTLIDSYDADNPAATNYKVMHGDVILGELILKQMSLIYDYNAYIGMTQPIGGGSSGGGGTVVVTEEETPVAFPSSGPAILCGDRYNLDGTDVILLRSNIDSFINGGKYNKFSAPLAKFYVHNKESQNVQVINYDQPARTFFPVAKLSELEFTFERACMEDDPHKMYNFHHLQWYMQIVVKTIDHSIPKTITPSIPLPDITRRERHEEEYDRLTKVPDYKKHKGIYIFYALAASVFGFVLFRRMRKQ